MNFDGTSWNATVDQFEDAQLISAGSNSFVTFAAIGNNLPDFLGGVTGNGSDNTLVGTAGGETLDGAGGNDILVGLGSNDTLLGGAGADMLLCGSGNDILNGGIGNDVVSGGRGADSFTFADTGAANMDLIVDYSYVEGDKIDLSAFARHQLRARKFGFRLRAAHTDRVKHHSAGRYERCGR